MSDPTEPGSDFDDTAPLAGAPLSSESSWVPPTTQPPPRHYAAPTPPPPWASDDGSSFGDPPRQSQPGYAADHASQNSHPGPSYPPPGTRPMPAYAAPLVRDRQPRGRVSRSIWPVVCALALVVGALAGALGGAAYQRLSSEPDRDGIVSGGLEQAGAMSEPPLPARGSVASVAREVLPSTVQIVAQYQGQADGATGSGFVLDAGGHFVTNNHVVADAAQNDGPIEIVDHEGNRYAATVVGRSPTYDLAVLFVEEAPGLPPASLGSSGALNVGDPVVAFGSPLGLSSTVTAGIVSALDRPVTTGDSNDELTYINAVQTDAAINPGNSGGPLVNLEGQVVGVNSAIATTGGAVQGDAGNIGVGFAIPVDQVKLTADQILRTGEARYPVIGAKVSTNGSDEASGRGAKISEVLSGSPAEDAGMQEGDVVTEIDGVLVDDQVALIVTIRSHRPGDSVRMTVLRDDDELVLSVVLGSEVG